MTGFDRACVRNCHHDAAERLSGSESKSGPPCVCSCAAAARLELPVRGCGTKGVGALSRTSVCPDKPAQLTPATDLLRGLFLTQRTHTLGHKHGPESPGTPAGLSLQREGRRGLRWRLLWNNQGPPWTGWNHPSD